MINGKQTKTRVIPRGGLPQGIMQETLTLNQIITSGGLPQGILQNSISAPLGSQLPTVEEIIKESVEIPLEMSDKRLECENFQNLGLWAIKGSTLNSHEMLNTPIKKLNDSTDSAYSQQTGVSPWSQIDTSSYPSTPVFHSSGYIASDHEDKLFDINLLTEPQPDNDDLNKALANNIEWDDLFDTLKKEVHMDELSPFYNKNDLLNKDFDHQSGNIASCSFEKPHLKGDELLSDIVVDDNLTNYVEKKFDLHLNVDAKPKLDVALNTPEVLFCVEQLEVEKQNVFNFPDCNSLYGEDTIKSYMSSAVSSRVASPSCLSTITTVTSPTYKSDTQSECEDIIEEHKYSRRHYDSDDDYIPHTEMRKNRKRKMTPKYKEEIPEIKKAKRGRPPKRRESITDDNISNLSVEELKYRELRDKNNEASKRSRMNRKHKEIQMEQQAIELENRNKQLRIKADVLEEMTKKLKDALMNAILKK